MAADSTHTSSSSRYNNVIHVLTEAPPAARTNNPAAMGNKAAKCCASTKQPTGELWYSFWVFPEIHPSHSEPLYVRNEKEVCICRMKYTAPLNCFRIFVRVRDFQLGFTIGGLKGGILVFWESWQNHFVNCEELKFCKIWGLKCEAEKWREEIFANNDSQAGRKCS